MLRRILSTFAITWLCGFGMACGDDDNASNGCPSGTTYEQQEARCVGVTLDSDAGADGSPATDADSGDQTTDPDSGPPAEDSGGQVDTGPQCASGESLCDDQCVDLMTSSEHCNGCNQACSGAQSCQNGQCVCPAGQELCGDECVDTSSNDAHCGSCNAPCQGGYVCAQNQCHENDKIAGVIQALNNHRSTDSNCGSYGDFDAVSPVQGDPLLHQAAQRHADDMADNNFFDHTGSDDSNFSQRISESGYSGWPVGENIAAGGSDPASVMQRWMDSDGHCRNNMNGSATYVGVGYAFNPSSQYGSYWVLKLAR